MTFTTLILDNVWNSQHMMSHRLGKSSETNNVPHSLWWFGHHAFPLNNFLLLLLYNSLHLYSILSRREINLSAKIFTDPAFHVKFKHLCLLRWYQSKQVFQFRKKYTTSIIFFGVNYSFLFQLVQMVCLIKHLVMINKYTNIRVNVQMNHGVDIPCRWQIWAHWMSLHSSPSTRSPFPLHQDCCTCCPGFSGQSSSCQWDSWWSYSTQGISETHNWDFDLVLKT